ncbi:hypothetical protein D3C76_903240 [compost metagenome]
MRVVDAVLEWRPVLAAILGAQDQVEHADHIAQLVVGEPDVEQRLVGALLDQPLTFGDQQWPLLVGRLGTGQRRIVRDEHSTDLAAIQLLAPGGAGIAAVQYHTVAAHGPALLRRREGHRVEVGADRHAGLQPAFAVIVGVQNMAPLPDSDQPRAGTRNAEQGAAHGQRTGLGRLVQHIHQRCRLSDTLQQHRHRTQQHQHELFQGTHTAPSQEYNAARYMKYSAALESLTQDERRWRRPSSSHVAGGSPPTPDIGRLPLSGCRRPPGLPGPTAPSTGVRCT